MNPEYLTASAAVLNNPWLIIIVMPVALLIGGQIYLLYRLATVKTERNEGRQVLDEYITDNAILSERLTAKKQ